MVADAAAYPWSSHRRHVEGRPDSVITPHPAYLALGRSEAERREAYRAIFDEPLDAKSLEAIRDYVQQQRALGSARFQAQIEDALGRCMSVRPAHRPPAERKGC
jgi:putative transposase